MSSPVEDVMPPIYDKFLTSSILRLDTNQEKRSVILTNSSTAIGQELHVQVSYCILYVVLPTLYLRSISVKFSTLSTRASGKVPVQP
ncbi:hypothetical protein Pdw03_7558 [Penicillium digitatum]|uniref:Uncharacterized protein n=1 Tax=Penicillium digitatum TaxID=36651 RepID=A0A7T7BL06_PENDI|nr:hypothetical protein Pdw03_7558 [Penicillium digitatum]